MNGHLIESPSAWVQRWSHLAPAGATVLDIACGHGRHMRWFAERGHAVTGIDRSPDALASASRWGQVIETDIENGPWPLLHEGAPRQFGLVVVTNYLWRALLPLMAGSIAPGGVLLYETFAIGNESVGKPSRPDFLLQPGELLRAFGVLRVIAYEDGFMAQPPRFVQRLAAVREQPPSGTDRPPARYRLD